MSDLNPVFPQQGLSDRYVNPWLNVAQQYLPRNMDAMLQWADYFLRRVPFFRSAVGRVSNYFITQLNIDCDSTKDKEEYEAFYEQIKWRQHVAELGTNLLVYGNEFVSANQGFNRFLMCNSCKKVTVIDRCNYTFNGEKWLYTMQCKRCNQKGAHEVRDRFTEDVKKMIVKHWAPREVLIRQEDVTEEREHYWRIPKHYLKRIKEPNNKFFSKYTPKYIYDVMRSKKELMIFNKHTFLHLRGITPAGLVTDGKSIPPCMYLFDDFFKYAVLNRTNEAICFEDINPFRVIAMASGGDGISNPILNQNADLWKSAVDEMIDLHRIDPGSYHTFPFTLNYQQMGGQAKQLMPVDVMKDIRADILSSLNVPQELFNMNMQFQAVGPALRLFENCWSALPDSYDEFLQFLGDNYARIKGLKKAKITMLRTSLVDNMERKQIVMNLAASNAIAKSTMLKMYDLDYEEQLRAKMEEDVATQKVQQEIQRKQQFENMDQKDIFGQSNQQGVTPQDAQQQAQEIAQQLVQLPAPQIRDELQKIKSTDETKYALVKKYMEDLRSQARSQGGAQLSGQANNTQQQPQQQQQ